MNVYDSVKMADVMDESGYVTSNEADEADLVVLNTCHIREKAAEKMYSELGRVRKLKETRAKQGKPLLVAVAGCVAQAEGEAIMKRAPVVDMVVGPQSIQRLPDMVKNAEIAHAKHQISLDFAANNKFDVLPEAQLNQGSTAFVSVQEGCDKFCTFCVVPYTRGAEFSRSVSEVYREALTLVSNGAKEITLLGQNVNAFHGTGPDKKVWDLAQLITLLADIPELEGIRYTTSHPRDMTQSLIDAHRDIPKLMPYLHLPIQSGSNNVLKAMNRKHTRDVYLKTIEDLRAARPDIAMSCDFIVGFPGETDQDFEDTMDLVRQVGYASAYSFKYSPRPGTPAATKDEQVPEDVKSERLARLQALLNEQQLEFNKNCVGKTMSVLLDREGKYENQFIGRSPYMQAVHVTGDLSLGDRVDVLIEEAHANSLKGVIMDSNMREPQAASAG